MMGSRRHPFHRPVAILAEPAHEVRPMVAMTIRAREPASSEAQLLCLRAYCFL
jgi:hypothetical protein